MATETDLLSSANLGTLFGDLAINYPSMQSLPTDNVEINLGLFLPALGRLHTSK